MKSPEERWKRDNYLDKPIQYKINQNNWILTLSSAFIEYHDIETSEQVSKHDLLTAYSKNQKLGRLTKFIINAEFILETVEEIDNQLQLLHQCCPTELEYEIYDAINADSKQALKKIFNENYSEDKIDLEILYYLWEEREKYGSGFNYRIALIVSTMWQIRMAALQTIITEKMAWDYLYKLTNLIRSSLSMFSCWEEFLENLRLFNIIENYDNQAAQKDFENAIICLSKVTQSPLKIMPYNFGLDENNPYKLKSHSYKVIKPTDTKDLPAIQELTTLLKQDNKQALWNKLANLQQIKNYHLITKFSAEWGTNILSEEDIIELPQLYPKIHYAYLIRGDYYSSLADDARGEGTSDTVGEDNYRLFFERLSYAANDLQKAYELKPDDPLVWASLVDVLSHFNTEHTESLLAEIHQLIETYALDHPYCTIVVARYKQQRWGGSHDQGIDWANTVINGTKKGDVSRLIIFTVTIERYDYIRCFDEEEDLAESMFINKSLKSELNIYFDELISNIDKNPHNIASQLAFWYRECKDIERLRIIGRSIKPGYYNLYPLSDCYSDKKVIYFMNWIQAL